MDSPESPLSMPESPLSINQSEAEQPEVIVIGSGLMGSRIAAWLLLLGERVRVWTTTNRFSTTVCAACDSSRDEVHQAMESEASSGFSLSAATAAGMICEGDSELLASLPFTCTDAGLRVKPEIWERLSFEANDGRPGREDHRTARNAWLAIDCTRDPNTPEERTVAIQRAKTLLARVRAQSPECILAIKHEGISFSEVEACAGFPVVLLRFLKPVFFMPFVEVQGTDPAITSRLSGWLEGLQLMPFRSAKRVRMMRGSRFDASLVAMMRRYALQRYMGFVPEGDDMCCICLDQLASVANALCGHKVFCTACAVEYTQGGERTCPLCRVSWNPDCALVL
eukprot:gnl/TRDRNA2_/TRDRNA2_151570_c0_seq1.p1 gnl/TRDRNA2_/TRDRNA2_151570_c0~~gnl/TRDRNA2_/TRDRNA2_151570_c0_seq1.p1  ORF type:complete len:339 (+),score=35.06 gnl/TRDRNA2_/TRDRNA2_151570_c0_seq1:67-1083(+)